MKKSKIIIQLNLLLLLFSTSLFSQGSNIYNDQIRSLEELTNSKLVAKVLHQYDITPNLYIKYKELLNLNLSDELLKGDDYSIEGITAFSDNIVIGKVKHIETDSSVLAYFHSKVIVEVDSVLKGSLSKNEIIIKLESGPIGVNFSGNTVEPNFYIGENLLLFLTKRGYYAKLEWLKKMGLDRNLLQLQKQHEYELVQGMDYYLISSKNIIKNESVFRNGNLIELLKKTIMSINNVEKIRREFSNEH